MAPLNWIFPGVEMTSANVSACKDLLQGFTAPLPSCWEKLGEALTYPFPPDEEGIFAALEIREMFDELF